MQVVSVIVIFSVLTLSAAQKNITKEKWLLVPDVNLNLQRVSVEDVRFQLSSFAGQETEVVISVYTRKNPISGQVITTGDIESIRNSNYNPLNPSRFFIHGYLHAANELQNQMLRDKYLEIGDNNVFFVDWSIGSITIKYYSAIANTERAGKQIARFIDFMNAKGRMSFDTLYVIGHSLGAHVAGFIGKNTKNGRINTIIALDLAKPVFALLDSSQRLALGDANYVELIHTGSDGLGFDLPIGNASFYFNWGNNQPGCKGSKVCDHHISYDYFRESLGPGNNEFYAIQCENYKNILLRSCRGTGRIDRMGGDPSNFSRGASGVYYLPVNSHQPYANGSAWL